MSVLRIAAVAGAILATTTVGAKATDGSYVDHITGAESGGDYAIFNTLGHTEALGRYQFIPSTFAGLGFMTQTGNCTSSWSCYSFNSTAHAAGVYSLDDLRHTAAGHALQDQAFNQFTEANWGYMNSTTQNTVGTTVNGVTITRESLLSAAHFLGPGALNDYVASGFDPTVLPWSYVTANGFSSYAELQDYLMNRMADASGTTYDGSFPGGSGGGGMIDVGTDGFPGFGSKRVVRVQERPPFQGQRPNLRLGGS